MGALRRVLTPTETVEVAYRGQEGALFKRDYGRLFLELVPRARSCATRASSGRDEGWDDVTWWLLEKP